MEKEQIIKALEWCSGLRLCVDCPMRTEGYFSHSGNACRKSLMENALALIKELTAKTKVLEAERNNYKEWYFQTVSENKNIKTDVVREIFKEIYSSLNYIEEQMEPEEIPECFFSVREDINALKEKFESEGAADG